MDQLKTKEMDLAEKNDLIDDLRKEKTQLLSQLAEAESGKSEKTAIEQELNKLEKERDGIKEERKAHDRFKLEAEEKFEEHKTAFKKLE